MSKLITNTVRHTSGSADNITLDSSQNVTVEGNLTVDGTTTFTGDCSLPDDTVDIADLSATGTASSSTYLRGDNSWATVSGGVSSDSDRNTGGGDNAVNSVTSGQGTDNTGFGYDAGTALTTGDYNTAVGSKALKTGATCTGNTAVGWRVLEVCEDGGEYNTCVGYFAGGGITTGDNNIAIGASSLDAAVTGANNVAVGTSSLSTNTSGAGNIAIGSTALRDNTTASDNTAVGNGALVANETGAYNVAIGSSAMAAGTVNDQVAIGHEALKTHSTGLGRNTAVGKYSLRLTTGNQNTAFGFYSGISIGAGACNTMIGHECGQATNIGNSNTFVGFNTGYLNTEGTNNTFIGREAGYDVNTGDDNVCIGFEAGKGQITTASNNLFIARDNVDQANAAAWIVGGSTGACVQGNNSSSWSTTSDERIKKNIVDNTEGLSVIDKVKVRNFKYKQYDRSTAVLYTADDDEVKNGTKTVDDVKIPSTYNTPKTAEDTIDLSSFPSGTTAHHVIARQGVTETQIGVIAQELETVCPGCVKTDQKGLKTVDTDELFWHMLNAIKELSAKVTALEAG